MAEIIVTVGDNSLLPMLEKAISLLKGVTKVSVRKEKAKPEISSVTIFSILEINRTRQELLTL